MKVPIRKKLVPGSIRRAFPRQVRSNIVRLYLPAYDFSLDFLRMLANKRGEFTPPWHVFSRAGIGGRAINFDQDGADIFRYITELGQLKPTESVLEVGCGIGRNAVPLTRYLNASARYEGLDIVPQSIAWCQRKITPKYSNFKFRLADVYNKGYNPQGKFSASEYRFPYDDESFDFVFLNSVFTHTVPKDTQRYLLEIARVLKTAGRCIVTFLLLNPEIQKMLESGSGYYDLKYESGPCRFVDEDLPEATIAYQEGYVRDLYDRFGLRIIEPVRYGWWPGRVGTGFYSGQDLIVAVKSTRL